MFFKAVKINYKYILVIIILICIVVIFSLSKLEKMKKNVIEILPEQIENDVRIMAPPKITQLEKVLEIPEKYQEYNIIAKLEIPKINLVTYVIDHTTEKTLDISVTKLCGPGVNEIGNLCITGHNYIRNNMFYKLKDLEVGDKIILTDVYGNELTYDVYKAYQVMPDNIECLTQETNGEKEVTLITCTIGARKRLIIKASEFYD